MVQILKDRIHENSNSAQSAALCVMNPKVFCIVYTFLFCVDCYRILGLFPYEGRSHYDVFEPLLNKLARDGHVMIIASHFPPKIAPENWYQINLSTKKKSGKEIIDMTSFDSPLGRFLHVWDTFSIADISIATCNVMTLNPEVKSIVDSKQSFDIVLTEQFLSDCGLAIAHILDCPIVGLQSHAMMPWTYDRFDQPNNPAYIPTLLLKYGPHMSFLERVENTIFDIYYKLFYELYITKQEQAIVEKNLNHSIPPLGDIAKNISVLLTNTHYTLNGVKPFVPSVVEVGGMHIRRTLATVDAVSASKESKTLKPPLNRSDRT